MAVEHNSCSFKPVYDKSSCHRAALNVSFFFFVSPEEEGFMRSK